MEVKEIVEVKDVPVQNMYLTATLTAFKEFLQEEAAGNVFAELRLMNKIKAARRLFWHDREILDTVVEPNDGLSNVFYRMTKNRI